MDWTAIAALCAAASVVGGGVGALANRSYARGNADAASKDALTAAAAMIGRLDLNLTKLSDTLGEHKEEDAAKFARLETMSAATSNALLHAAQEMSKLTDRINALYIGKRGI